MVVRINGKSVELPASFESLKTRQYEKLLTWDRDKQVADRDYFKLFCILADQEFSGIKADSLNELTLWHCVRWVLEEHFPKDPIPKFIDINGKSIDIPKKIQLLSIGQNIQARQIIDKSVVLTDEKGNILDCNCYSMIVAIYLQPLIDGKKFSFERAKELAKDIGELPITTVRPIGFFLLKSVLKSGKMRMRNFNLTPHSLLQKLKETFLL